MHVAVNAVLRLVGSYYAVRVHRYDDASADLVSEFAGATATSDATAVIALGFVARAPYATCSVTLNVTLDFDP